MSQKRGCSRRLLAQTSVKQASLVNEDQKVGRPKNLLGTTSSSAWQEADISSVSGQRLQPFQAGSEIPAEK